jgi:glycosyltransferase involved in cell wall biosynthesis
VREDRFLKKIEQDNRKFGDRKPYSVIIFCHNRSELLEQSILSVLNADNFQDWNFIVVQQIFNSEVDRVLNKYAKEIDLLLRFPDIGHGVLGNINYGRLLGTSCGFEFFSSDLVLGIEEDTQISKDALTFIQHQYNLRFKDPKFRGINLCSYIPYSVENRDSYSLLRFGISGQAGVLTSKTWGKFNLSELLSDIGNEEWASRMEPFLKTGYMVHPNNSRLFDQGWAGYSSPFSKETDDSFRRQHLSWVNHYVTDAAKYIHEDRLGVWRKDAIIYKRSHNLYFNLRRFQSFIFFYRLWKFVKLPLLKDFVER